MFLQGGLDLVLRGETLVEKGGQVAAREHRPHLHGVWQATEPSWGESQAHLLQMEDVRLRVEEVGCWRGTLCWAEPRRVGRGHL